MNPSAPSSSVSRIEAPSMGILAAFAAIYVIWGSTYLAIRFAVESIPPFLMAGSHFLVAGLLLYGVAVWRGASQTSWRQWRHAAWAGFLMLLVGNGGVTWAEQTIPSGVAALIVALIPLWMVLLDWCRPGGARPGPLVLAGLVIGFAGVLFLVSKPSQAVGNEANYLLGVLALIAATVCWALGSLFNRRADKPASSLQAVAMQMISGGFLMFLLGMILGESRTFAWSAITQASAWSWVYLTVIGSLVGFTAYVWLLGVSSPARVSTYAFVNPLIAVALGCSLGREPFTSELVLAACLITVAVAMIVSSGWRRRPPRGVPVAYPEPPSSLRGRVPCLESDTK